MKKKRCIICNRPYNHHYDLFGRSCLANLYTQLNISNSRLISNKEKHLCNVIARRHLKFFLGKEKKYALAENYIALDYLKRIDLKFTEDIKNLLKENITRISVFNKYLKSMLPIYSLNDFYKIYNDYMEFKKLLNENIINNNDFCLLYDKSNNNNNIEYKKFEYFTIHFYDTNNHILYYIHANI